MIVRIAGEGQFELDDAKRDPLNELDNVVVAAVEAGDESRFRTAWHEMLAFVEREGRPVPNDELMPSDAIFPPRDVTFEEARGDFTGDGLLPD